ncbi:MAG: 4-(cytidine 5'-diphospho)-2-C-methyl-D-erythritol kinase [Deltaproteobacteria bacterium]|nr:4-(cytidine 5'-diphospho)-2-C-methyl-D-erythritol kinase [Deltaproteobacteria bacterium]
MKNHFPSDSMDLYYYAPAKINFSLKIGKRGPNNLHEIQSLTRKIGIFDKISFKFTNGDYRISVIPGKILEKGIFKSELESISNADNMAIKAAKIYFKILNIKNKGVDILIEKNIPIKAGLGGGSSDAAGMLLKLNEIFNSPLSINELRKLAFGIGSDVTFFLTKGDAVITGFGESIYEISEAVLPKYFIVLIIPDFGIDTKGAYNDFDDFLLTNNADYYNIQYLDFKNIKFENDFEPVIFRKHQILRGIKDSMMQCGAELSLLSGSGSAVFGAFKSKEKAVAYLDSLGSFPFNKRVVLGSLATTL